MKRELTYATVCSGIECCSVACIGLPMRPVFFSEIEPFPCAVLKAHYPDVPNLGDMSKIQVSNDGKEITNGTARIVLDRRIDILAGGTPCQDISQAGKQRGMAKDSNTRSSLAFDFVRLASELRPKYVVWENVAATISSKIAGDFLRFMSALDDCGYSLAWRVLDAQYVRVDGMERAVPQRRRRVWVVGCAGADESVPAQILFEPDCVAGHTPPRRRAGQGFAYTLAGRDRVDAGVVGGAPGVGGEPESGRGGEAAIGRGTERGEIENACRGCGGDGGGDKGTCITLDGGEGELPVLDMMGGKAGAHFTTDNTSPTFTRGRASVNDIHAIALDGDKLKPREDQRKGGNGFGINEEGVGYTLTAVDRHGVAYESQCFENHAQDSRIKPIEVSDTRNQKDGTGGNNLPLVVMAYRPPTQDLIAEACAKYGADWPEDDWVEITDDVVLNIYTDMDGRRKATAFQKSDANLEFGVDISYVGDGATGKCKCFSKVSHPTAPNGEGERWDEREVAQTRNTFDNGEKRCQEVVVSANGVSFDGRKDAPIAEGVAHSQTIGTNPGFKDGVVVSMAQNTRDEVRIVNGDGQIAGALLAEPGMKQQTYVVSTNSNGEDVAATLDHNTGATNGICAQNDKRGGYVVTKQGGGNDIPRDGEGLL